MLPRHWKSFIPASPARYIHCLQSLTCSTTHVQGFCLLLHIQYWNYHFFYQYTAKFNRRWKTKATSLSYWWLGKKWRRGQRTSAERNILNCCGENPKLNIIFWIKQEKRGNGIQIFQFIVDKIKSLGNILKHFLPSEEEMEKEQWRRRRRRVERIII